jgi:hypothetical protein
MDMNDLKELLRINASMQVELHQCLIRNVFVEWNLLCHVDVFASGQWRKVCFPVMSNKYRHSIFSALTANSIPFVEYRLPAPLVSTSPVSSSPELPEVQLLSTESVDKKRCKICHKTSFKTPRKCMNSELSASAKHGWVCNLEVSK